MDIRTKVPAIYGDWVERFGGVWSKQVEGLRARFGDSIEEIRTPGDYPTDMPIVYVPSAKIIELLTFLRDTDGYEYNFLADLTATDEESEPRFEVVYQLLSRKNGWRIRLKVRVAEGSEVPTAVNLWSGADWAEREVWDMYGIRFTGHPNMRRILMDERWEGHPLRKDYPLRGYQLFPTPMEIDESQLK